MHSKQPFHMLGSSGLSHAYFYYISACGVVRVAWALVTKANRVIASKKENMHASFHLTQETNFT